MQSFSFRRYAICAKIGVQRQKELHRKRPNIYQTLRSRIYSRVEKTVKEIRVNNVKFS